MPNFIPYDYNQNSMVVINFLDQLQPGTFEHAIHYLIENNLNLSVYFPSYKNETNGRPDVLSRHPCQEIIKIAYLSMDG